VRRVAVFDLPVRRVAHDEEFQPSAREGFPSKSKPIDGVEHEVHRGV
jgi:hypothetical protein